MKNFMIILLCVSLGILSACSIIGNTGKSKMLIKDIAYKHQKQNESEYTVYLQEKDSLEPYLVLTSDYNGSVLLMRKYVWDDLVYYSEEKSQGTRGGYYPASNVDKYLNTIFFSALSLELQNKILDTAISVVDFDSIGKGGGRVETEIIQRKIFLLSASEMNISSGMSATEGKRLNYFKNESRYIATYKNGIAEAYWLRSTYLWDDIQGWSIGSDGYYGGSSVSSEYALRPVFCLSCDTIICEKKVDRKTIYVISE